MTELRGASNPTWTETPHPDEGVISWNINTACNYRCSYCTQRFKDDRGRWSRDTPLFMAAFAKLPGRWEIKLSGGEPFVHPTLLELVGGLARAGHRVSVVTNFSSNETKLQAFVDAALGRVGNFSCSLHLEYVDSDVKLEAFIDKARWLTSALEERRDPALPSPSLCVTTVATREILPKLEELAERFKTSGITFKVQPEKQDRDVVEYSPSDHATLLKLGGHNLTGEVSHNFAGRPCWAGARYFILDDDGNAYRCYPARRYKREFLGNFLSPDFSLHQDARPCQYAYCNCTVPIARRMMPILSTPAELAE